MGEAPICDGALIFSNSDLLHIYGLVSGKGWYIAAVGSLSMGFGVLKHGLTGLSCLVCGACILSIQKETFNLADH